MVGNTSKRKMMRLQKWILICVFLTLFIGCSEEKGQPTTGKELYEYYCAACHQESGAGQFLRGIPPLIRNKALNPIPLSPSQVKHKIQGSAMPDKKMPSFANLSDREAKLIAVYIQQLSK